MDFNKYIKYKTKYIDLFINQKGSGQRYISSILKINHLIYPSIKYNQFFTDINLKKYYHIKNQDGFNIASCKLNDTQEIYCIRYLGTIYAYFEDEIIPGNFSNLDINFIKTKISEEKLKITKIGKNFFWNSWNDNLIDNTIFFVGSYSDGKFNIDTKIEPFIIHNKIALTNLNEGKIKYNDIRLFNNNNKIYCYDSLITSIYEIGIINNKIQINFSFDKTKDNKLYIKNKLCSKCDNTKDDENCFIKQFDKNWSLINVTDKTFEFLNWFENNYVTITLIDKITGSCYKKNIIKMNKDIIDGLGNDIMPMFSFGTPILKLDNNDSNILYTGICAGHTKIINSKKYNNKNIDLFLENKKNLLNNNSNYIEHNSYIYLCYFIKIIKYKDTSYKMFISDSFLFVDMKKEYIFSICFPMGLFEKNNNIILSYGYGDYYNCLLDFNKTDLLNNIIHDVELFDYDKYNYHIINV